MTLFWKFIHHALIHGLLMWWPWEPQWVDRLHEWTGGKIKDEHGRSDNS
jgi:hypothetical protein